MIDEHVCSRVGYRRVVSLSLPQDRDSKLLVQGKTYGALFREAAGKADGSRAIVVRAEVQA